MKKGKQLKGWIFENDLRTWRTIGSPITLHKRQPDESPYFGPAIETTLTLTPIKPRRKGKVR